MSDIPITKVILKDGRMGTVRMSKTALKFARRNKSAVNIHFEGRLSQMVRAKEIKEFISIEY